MWQASFVKCADAIDDKSSVLMLHLQVSMCRNFCFAEVFFRLEKGRLPDCRHGALIGAAEGGRGGVRAAGLEPAGFRGIFLHGGQVASQPKAARSRGSRGWCGGGWTPIVACTGNGPGVRCHQSLQEAILQASDGLSRPDHLAIFFVGLLFFDWESKQPSADDVTGYGALGPTIDGPTPDQPKYFRRSPENG